MCPFVDSADLENLVGPIVDRRVRERLADNVLRTEVPPRSLPASKLAAGGAVDGDGLVWNGSLWVPQSVVADPGGGAKGDMLVHNGTDWELLEAAAGDGYGITSDTSQAGGVKWVGADVIGINLNTSNNHASPGGYLAMIASSALASTWVYRTGMPRGYGLDANSNGYIVIPRNGMYEFSGNIAWASTSSLVATAARWRIGAYSSPGSASATSAGLAHRSSVSEIMGTPLPAQAIYCTAGQHVWVDAYWTWSGGAGNYGFVSSGWTYIQAKFLGA